MTYFTSLSPSLRYALTGLLFIAALSVLFLCIYKYISRRNFKAVAPQLALLFALIIALSYFTAASEGAGIAYEIRLPFALLPLVSALCFIYSAFGIARERRKNRQTPSQASIKQALDNLNSGVCFSDGAGRIILINRTMERLFSSVIGSRPQLLSELEAALKGSESGVTEIQGSPSLYRFADGSVWSIESLVLKENELEGFVQTSAHNITEIITANELIAEENKRLAETIEKMQLMLERLADRIREEETLKLKTQIHNDIGTSLIEITKIIEGRADGDMDRQLDALQQAVSYFSNNYLANETQANLEATALKLKEMGVLLEISGAELLGVEALSLACAAAEECAKNAINHAGGDKVFLKISKGKGSAVLEFTNNGIPPRGIIKEGGGLSAIRRRIEDAGGRMEVFSAPEFRLRIELLTEDKND